MNETIFKQINNKLLESQRVLITSHKNPDADACGSVLAIFLYLRELGKEVEIYICDPAPSYFEFLPHAEDIKNDKSVLGKQWDAVIVLDSGDLTRTLVERDKLGSAFIINMDHHITNTHFGNLDYINEQSSSTCEIIYDFFKFIDYPIDKKIASCLLAGILGDTDGFSNLATTFKSMSVASQLIKNGARINRITDSIVRSKSLNGLRVWGLVLSRFQINTKLDIVYTYIKEEDLKKYQVSEEEVDGLANFLNVVADVSVAMLFRINDNNIRVNLRTTKDNIRVDKLANFFGGGGHQKASGFTIPWNMGEKNNRLYLVD